MEPMTLAQAKKYGNDVNYSPPEARSIYGEAARVLADALRDAEERESRTLAIMRSWSVNCGTIEDGARGMNETIALLTANRDADEIRAITADKAEATLLLVANRMGCSENAPDAVVAFATSLRQRAEDAEKTALHWRTMFDNTKLFLNESHARAEAAKKRVTALTSVGRSSYEIRGGWACKLCGGRISADLTEIEHADDCEDRIEGARPEWIRACGVEALRALDKVEKRVVALEAAIQNIDMCSSQRTEFLNAEYDKAALAARTETNVGKWADLERKRAAWSDRLHDMVGLAVNIRTWLHVFKIEPTPEKEK